MANEVVVCTSNAKAKGLIAGTVERRCYCCQSIVWSSPHGVRMQRERGALIICIRCFLEKAKREPVAYHPLTPEQIRVMSSLPILD